MRRCADTLPPLVNSIVWHDDELSQALQNQANLAGGDKTFRPFGDRWDVGMFPFIPRANPANCVSCSHPGYFEFTWKVSVAPYSVPAENASPVSAGAF